MPKLTDIQLVLLSTAAQRDGGALLPLPKRLKIEPGALNRVLKGLLKKGLVAEQPAPPDAPAWRETGDQRLMLVIAPAGLEAIGVEPEGPEPATGQSSKRKSSAPKNKRKKPRSGGRKLEPATGSVRPGTKLALLIEMLGRDGGATIPEIVAATGWQPHSVRGAISGAVKKKLGLAVSSQSEGTRGRVYRIVGAN
jgi:hypothetical protein